MVPNSTHTWALIPVQPPESRWIQQSGFLRVEQACLCLGWLWDSGTCRQGKECQCLGQLGKTPLLGLQSP